MQTMFGGISVKYTTLQSVNYTIIACHEVLDVFCLAVVLDAVRGTSWQEIWNTTEM